MSRGSLPADSANQRKLFELWFQARERARARNALAAAARSSGDTELYLYLAQLQMEDREWQAMQDTVLASCSRQLQDRYVSRANLLLGVSLLKQDREVEARRAFINATLVGGANAQAAEWLRFMEAAPATEDELRRVRGPCYGSEGKKDSLQAAPPVVASRGQEEAAESGDGSAGEAEAVEVKVVPGLRFFYVSQSQALPELLPQVRSLAVRLNVSLVKAGGSADGPLNLLSLPGEELRLALPARGSPQARGRYRVYKSEQFKCAWLQVSEEHPDPVQAVTDFRDRVLAAGHQLTGESRLVFLAGEEGAVEVQLGIE